MALLTTLGLKGSTVFFKSTRPPAPAAKAVRKRVPKLPGS